MKSEIDVVIIGAGASGIFAAINAAKNNPQLAILIIEKTSKNLSKVKISGGGRCNVTHACFEPRELIKFYPRGNRELLGVFHQFNPTDTIDWFKERHIELKTEADGRMFPTTDSSQTIIDCFLKEIDKYNVNIQYQSTLTKIEPTNEGFDLVVNNESIKCKKLIIASGGINKIEQGKILADLGHSIIPPAPSLFTFNLPKHDILSLQGVVSNVEIKILGSKFIEQGPLLITHWGVSGPAVLKLSSWGARYLQEKNYEFDFMVNWLPQISNEEQLKELIQKQKGQLGAKKISNQFDFELPKKLKFYLLEKAGISLEQKWADLSKKQLNKLVETLFRDIYPSKGKTTFKSEFVSCGGIKLKEVNFKTMESKIIPNLYFSGEVLNIDALTGGFNFQAAWSTAFIAANNITID
jgi:predicted Rossmann fold flavoprotein